MNEDRPRRPMVSVVMPIHGRQPFLAEQLQALSDQDYAGPFEVLLSDNGMEDDTLALALSHASNDRRFRVIGARSRPGIPFALAVGINASAGQLICHCDADDQVVVDWLSHLVEAATDADVIGGAIDVEALNPSYLRTYRGQLAGGGLDRTADGLRWAIGANMCYWRDAYDRIGGFCPNCWKTHSDVDFSERSQRDHGLRLAFAPKAVVHYRLRRDIKSIFLQAKVYGGGAALSIALSGTRTRKMPVVWWATKGLVHRPTKETPVRQVLGWLWRVGYRWGYLSERLSPTVLQPCECHPTALRRKQKFK